MKILSMNGGGMAGYRTAKFLQLMEQELNTPCWTIFDMVVGVSAGSINGGMVCKKAPAKDIADAFRTYGEKIFGKSRCWFTRIFSNSQYDNKPLIELAKSNLDFDISECTPKFMTYALSINGNGIIKPKHWKSWEDKDVKMYDIIMASSSAPSMFVPYEIKENNVVISYIDGGIINNNPSIAALTESIKLGSKLDSIYILNIANGNTLSINPDKMKNLMGVATNLAFVTIAGAERTTEYQCHQLIGFNNHVVMPPKFVSSDSLDYALMDEQAKQMWDLHKKSIIDSLAK